jgi:hypothetical protein
MISNFKLKIIRLLIKKLELEKLHLGKRLIDFEPICSPNDYRLQFIYKRIETIQMNISDLKEAEKKIIGKK